MFFQFMYTFITYLSIIYLSLYLFITYLSLQLMYYIYGPLDVDESASTLYRLVLLYIHRGISLTFPSSIIET